MKKIVRIILFIVCFVLIGSFFYPVSIFANKEKINSSYLYFGLKSSYINQINQTKNSLDIIHPDYFNIDTEGNLNITSKFDLSFVREMQHRGIKVVPFLSNHWDKELGRKAIQNRNRLTDQLVQFVVKHNLDGVNIDIENIDHHDKTNFTLFIQMLRNKLPKGKMLSIAIPANPNGWKTGWHGAYDNKELSTYADYLFLMAYDQNWSGDTTPGPVAGYPWVEDSVTALIKEGVPSKKIMLGVPFYGRYWNDTGSIKGNSVTMNTVLTSWVNKYNIDIRYDVVQKSYIGTFRVGSGDTLPVGNYVLWFDGEKSLKEKINLVHQYNLLGIGSWALSQEHISTWDYFDTWLSQKFFKVYEGKTFIGEFQSKEEAINQAKKYQNAKVVDAKTDTSVWDNFPITYETNRITFTKNTHFFKEPFEYEKVWGTFKPITLLSFAKKETDTSTWYLVETWLGPSWIKYDGEQITPAENQHKIKTLYKREEIYCSPFDESVASIAPQQVHVLMTYKNWAKIRTWIGEKWVKQDYIKDEVPILYNEKLYLTERTNLYHLPFENEKTNDYVSPQVVEAVKKHENWFKINTWIGEKWIKDENIELVEEEIEMNEILTLHEKTYFYHEPYSTKQAGYLSPQNVQTISKKGEWIKIHTWIGPKWIKP